MRRMVCVVAIAVSAWGCHLTSGDIVARAERHTLTVEELARILGEGRMQLTPEAVEQLAWWWVEFSLLGQRLQAGDSLLDSLTILETRWPDVHRTIVDTFYARMEEARGFSDTTVDSAFAAGDLRVVDHILLSTRPSMSAAERTRRQRTARAIRDRLAAGASWEREARVSDDLESRPIGRLGVVTWGQTDPDFERAAFSLAPGELSSVVETPYGFHVIRRPQLDEVRELYTRALKDTLYLRMREAYADSLLNAADVRFTDDAPRLVQEAVDQPTRVKLSNEVIARYRGGALRVKDFIRWLQVMPQEVHMQLARGSEAERRETARKMIRYQLELAAAQEAGVTLPPDDWTAFRRQAAFELDRLRRLLQVDAPSPDGSERDVATEFLASFARDLQNTDFRRVPPYLADLLHAESRWSIRYDRLDEVLSLAQALRAETAAERDVGHGPAAGRAEDYP